MTLLLTVLVLNAGFIVSLGVVIVGHRQLLDWKQLYEHAFSDSRVLLGAVLF